MTGDHDRYPGLYRGRIVSYDGAYLGKATLEVPEVYGSGVPSPAAKMGGMGGGTQAKFGSHWLPPEGASVWVYFEFGGNIGSPVWIPGWTTFRDGESDFADFATEKDDLGDVPFRGSDRMTDFDDEEYIEPGPRRLPEFPKARGFRSESGHLIIMDDSEDAEVLQLTHKDGSMIEWGPGGSELHRVMGSQWESYYGNVSRHHMGDTHEVYEGKRKVTYHGDKEEKIVGNFKQVRQGDIQNELQGNLTQEYGSTYDKTMGSEQRTVQNNRQISVVGQELKGVGKDWGLTVTEFGSIQIGNQLANTVAFLISSQSGKVGLETLVDPLTGTPTTEVSVTDLEALLSGPLATVTADTIAEIDAPVVDVGPTASLVSVAGGGPGCARTGDAVGASVSMAVWIAAVVAAFASIGKVITPPVDFGTITGGSTKTLVG